MVNFLKVFAWLLLIGFAAAALSLAFHTSAHGNFSVGTVTVNGRELHGMEKLVVGSMGLLIGAVAAVCALLIAALAVVGSGILVFAVLAFTVLVLVAVTVPFLLPIIIPIILLAFLVVIAAKSGSKKGA